MNARSIVLALMTCFVGLTLCLADHANMGTWKLNEAQSKISTGSPKSTKVVYEAAGDNGIFSAAIGAKGLRFRS